MSENRRPGVLADLARSTSASDPSRADRERVFSGVQGALRRRARNRKLAVVALPVVIGGAFFWAAREASPAIAPLAGEVPVHVLAADEVLLEGAAVESGDRTEAGVFRVAEGGELRAEVDGARVALVGPAEVRLGGTDVVLLAGRARVEGSLSVRGAGCRLEPEDSFDVGVDIEARGIEVLAVQVFAGAIHRAEPQTACVFIDLEDPSTEAEQVHEAIEALAVETHVPSPPIATSPPRGARPPVAREPGPEPSEEVQATSPEPAPETAPVEPTALAREVAAYREALALRQTDEAGALARFRAIRSDFPGGALAHEVDIEILDLLARSRRTAELRREGQRFLERWPQSPRAADVRALIEH